MPSSSRLPSSAKFSTSGIPFNSASISCPSPGSKLSGMSSASTKTIMITLPGLKTTTSWAGFKLRILEYARSTLFLNTSSIALFLAFKLLMLKPFMVMLTSVFFPGQLLMVIGPRLVFLQGAATGGGGATTPPVLHATSNLIPHPLPGLSVRLAQTWAPLGHALSFCKGQQQEEEVPPHLLFCMLPPISYPIITRAIRASSTNLGTISCDFECITSSMAVDAFTKISCIDIACDWLGYRNTLTV